MRRQCCRGGLAIGARDGQHLAGRASCGTRDVETVNLGPYRNATFLCCEYQCAIKGDPRRQRQQIDILQAMRDHVTFESNAATAPFGLRHGRRQCCNPRRFGAGIDDGDQRMLLMQPARHRQPGFTQTHDQHPTTFEVRRDGVRGDQRRGHDKCLSLVVSGV